MAELKKKFYGLKRKYYPARQRFTLPLKEGEKRGTVLDDSKPLGAYGLADGGKVEFKDLGPQVRFKGTAAAETSLAHLFVPSQGSLLAVWEVCLMNLGRCITSPWGLLSPTLLNSLAYAACGAVCFVYPVTCSCECCALF